MVPVAVSEARRKSRLLPGLEIARDRMEEADRGFFERVEAGYKKLATEEPGRIKTIDATASLEGVSGQIWAALEPLVKKLPIPPPHLQKPAVDKISASATVSAPKKKLRF
jgi:thymidylate kinase